MTDHATTIQALWDAIAAGNAPRIEASAKALRKFCDSDVECALLADYIAVDVSGGAVRKTGWQPD